MKKIILALLFSASIYAAQVDAKDLSEIYVDKDGKAFTGEVVDYIGGRKYIYNVKNGKVSGMNKIYDESGNLYIKVNLKNGKKDGLFEEYHKNGKLSIKANYIDGLLEGPYEEYYENGKLSLKSRYKEDLLEGPYEEYYENGKLSLKSKYKEDLLEGPYEEYYENGKLSLKSKYKEGLLDGPYEEYYENGKISYKTVYEKDEIVSKEYFYDKKGELIKIDGADVDKDILAINQEMQSLLILATQLTKEIENIAEEIKIDKNNFSDSGELTLLSKKLGKIYIKYSFTYYTGTFEIFKDDKKIGYIKGNAKGKSIFELELNNTKMLMEYSYDQKAKKYNNIKYVFEEDGKKHEINFNEYGLNGLQKFYYPNGKIQIEIEMKNGYLNGISKEYDESGKLIKNLKYKEGELLK